jgi:acyl-CoA dehydrogenase
MVANDLVDRASAFEPHRGLGNIVSEPMMNLSDRWRSRSPFHKEAHHAWAQVVRRFLEREAAPHIEKWERDRMIPREFHRAAGDVGILGLGFPEEYGGTAEGIDTFHHLTQIDEIARLGCGGLIGGLTVHHLALRAILMGGSDEMKRRVVPEIISGEKIIAMGITEPSGGSDVAAFKTKAIRRGGNYEINGSKIFISNGIRADYYMTVARTGGPGMGGLSLLLVEGGAKGPQKTQLEKMGYHSSDTAALYYDDVVTPAENLIGAEGQGFSMLGPMFNYERLMMAQHSVTFARVCLEEALKWASERETFGKRLGQHQVIRVKLADMLRLVDATQAMVDICAWYLDSDRSEPADFAMLKVQATQTLEKVAREAAQVLGGASVLLGSTVERLNREVRINAIAGGSEEILLDFAGRRLGFPN